uniref:Uncharacterized protein n=1 Tax=Heterorhabditis bacteriophora TaxID=37862 RepID=A0A1I7WH05_HETBA
MDDIPQLFYTLSTPGTPISLLLWPTPYGTTISLVKPISKNKQIGIVLHKKKNRIAEVIADSSAARRGVPVKLPSPIKQDHFTAAVITEVAYRRLNPFAKNDQFFKRLDEVSRTKISYLYNLRANKIEYIEAADVLLFQNEFVSSQMFPLQCMFRELFYLLLKYRRIEDTSGTREMIWLVLGVGLAYRLETYT